MAFPVDILTNVDHETLEQTAEEYMSQLPYRNTEFLSLSDSKQIEIGLCNVSFVPLYGTDTEKKLLALFSPDDSNTVVGLYLLDRWWGVEDVLKTAEPSRTGLIKVSTLGERIVLYVLNKIVLRNEKSSEDVFFLCHCEHEAAKILWKDGEAIGFYSFKPKGSLCRNFVTQCYHLPVMDTIFVRKCHRGQGHAIKILEDFVGSFRNEYIGLKFPLSEAMYKVCEKYFSIYPADKEFLWEVEKIGSPFQRTLIVNRLQKLKLNEKDQVVSKLNFDEDDATAPMEIEFTEIQETTEYTVDIVEETIIDITKEVDDIPVTRRGRGSNLKRRAIRENLEERLSENVIRVQDIEAGVESSVEVEAMENLNTFSVKESETVLRSSVDTVTATVTNFAEFRGSQKEETHEIEKDIVTATSEGSPVTHLTTAGEIKNQRGSKEECEMVIKEYTIDIQGATIGSIDQSQLQSVVDVEIVKMSTGTEEEKNENLGKNKEVEEDEAVCEAEMEEIKQMSDEPKEEKTAIETEVAEQSETHAKSMEKEQAHWDVEITENKERAEDEVMAESEKDLTKEHRDGQEKSVPKDEDTVLQQSVEVKDQIEMEADSVREVLTTEEVLCDQPKQNEAETEVSEPNETMTNKDTLIEKASKNKLGLDEAKQVFNKSKLPQKRTSGLTPSRRSKRLRHQPAEKVLKTTKSVKTGQQRSKHHSKAMMQDEYNEQSTDEPEHDVSEVMEKIQEAQIENKAEAESEVDEYREKDVLKVETVSTMYAEITQVEETVFPEVSELVEREETDQEEAPLQSSVEPPEIQESKTTPEEDEETVQNSTVMLTLSEAKVVLVDLHELSPKEAGDNHGEIGSLAQENAVQENLEDEARVSTQRSLRRRTIRVQSPPRRKSRRIQKQGAEVFEDKTERVLITEKEADEVEQGVEIVDKEKAPQTSIVDATEKVIPLVEAEPEDNVVEKGVEEINKLENKETNLAVTRDTGEETPEVGEEATLEQQQNEPLDKIDKETAETETSIEFVPVVGKEQTHMVGGTTIQIEEKGSQVSLAEAEPDEEGEKVEEEKLEQDKPDNSEYQLCNLTSKEEEQQEQLQKDTEKTPEKDKIQDENTVEEQNEPDTQDMTFEEQKPTEDLEEQNDLKVTEIVEVYRAVDENVEEAVNSGEHPEKTTTMADETNIIQEAENDHNITLKEKQTDSDIEMSGVAQEAPETDQEILEEKASVSTERSLRRRTIKIQSPPRRKSRRLQKQEAEAFEDKTKNIPRRGRVADEMQETLKKSTIEATEIIPLIEAEPEVNVNKMEDKETNLAVTRDTEEETPEVGEEASLEQQQNEPLVKNDKETPETETSMEIDPVVGKEQTFIVGGTTIQIEEKVSQVSLVESEPDEEGEKDDGTPVIQLQIDPVVSKEQAHVVGGTTNQTEEKFSQGESTETDQSDNERITRRSLRLSAKSVTATQKTRKSTRLHKVEMDPVKETNMSRNKHEETSATTEETVNVCIPIITVESNMENLDEMTNTNVEETTAVAPETSELLMGEEINDKEEESQTVEEDKPTEAEPHEEVEKDDGTPVILQKDTLLLVDLNNLSQNTEEQTDSPEVLTHFHTEEQLELCEPDDSEYQLCNLTSEEDKQDMTVEGQKPTDDLIGQNDGKGREKVEEYKVVIDEDVEESVSTGEHPKATTMEDKTNIIQQTETNQDISLKEKQMYSDLEMRSLGQEAPEAVQEILEEEASVSTERNLRCRTVKIQSPPIKKSRRVKRQEAEVFEDKTGTVQLTGKGDKEVHKEGVEIDKEETLQKTIVEATENIVSLIEGEPDENVIEKGFEEMNNMENKETNLGNEAAPEMERDKVNLEQQENEPSVENENETAETEKPMGMDEVSVVNKEQTYGLEETTIQAEEELLQMESSETNENKSERTTRRSLRISSQSVTSTQKTRKSARLHKAELEPVKEAKMSRNEETYSVTAKTVNVCVPVTVETNVENLDEDGDVSKRVETISDEQDIDRSNDKGRVDEAGPEISTDVEEDETMTLLKITENEILVEMDKTQKDVEGGVQEKEKAEPSQENTEQEQEEAVALGENVGETDLTNEFKTTAVEEKVALENSEQEASFITRSLRYRTVTVQSTPRSKSKRLHRQELESERETDDLNVPIGKENEALIAEDSTAEFENLETKEGEGVIQTNTDGKSEKSETKDDTKEVGNEILFEIMESNSGRQVNTEQNKSQEENLERGDMLVPNEQEEAKPLQERENEGAAEGVQGNTADLEETAAERRSQIKRMTVETAAPIKSKRLRKQEHEDDSEQIKEADMGQTDSAELTFTEGSVELRSDATAAVFEGSNLGEEILQKIQKNAQGAKSGGDYNVHQDTESDAGESQEEQKQSRINKTQADEDQEEVMTDEIAEEVIEQHVDLESSTNEGFALALEVEKTSDREENKADEGSRVVMEAPKEIFTSAEKYEKGEENISDDDEKGLAIGKHVVQSSSTAASSRRKSIRLQMHESKTKEDESNSESEVEQTAKQRHQRKRKAITDSTSARRSKRHVRARIV